MTIKNQIEAFAVSYPIGMKPQIDRVFIRAIECQTDRGPRIFIKTPWAMLDLWGEDTSDDVLWRQAGSGYWRTEEDAQAYIDRTYPFRDRPNNEALMNALEHALRYGKEQDLYQQYGVDDLSTPSIFEMARGKVPAHKLPVKGTTNAI